MVNLLKGYLANGLFTMGDRLANEKISKHLRDNIENLDLYVPQENGDINDKNSYANSKMIAEGDCHYLDQSDFVVAVLDGVEIDSGVACEVGYAVAKGIPVFGLCTDVRQLGTDNEEKIDALKKDPLENQFLYRNLFVVGLIKNNGSIANNLYDLEVSVKERFDLRHL